MMFLGLFAVVFCEVAFLDIKSPDNKKVITGLNSLHLESLDNKKNTFFRFEKKSGFGSRKKGELYREDENGVRKYLCLLPTANTEVNLMNEKHNVFITKLRNNQFRVSNSQNDCLTIEDDKVTSKKCARNGNQHFNITFYKNNPEEIENVVDKDVKEVRDPDVEVDQMRSEKKKPSSTMYEDDVDVYVNEDEDKTEKEGVVWVEKPKELVTSDENMKYRVLKPERFKENQKTSVRIKPGVIEEKEVADVIEKIVSTTISTTITETVRKVEIVTEYLPVESTTTIKIPSEQILPPIHTAKSYHVESQLPSTVQIQTQSQSLLPELEPIYSTKLPEPASIHIKPEVESTKSFKPPEPEIYSSKLPEMEPSKRPELKPIYSSQISKTVSINKLPEFEPIYDVKPSKLENQYSYLESDSENSSDYNSAPPKIKRSAIKIRRKRSTFKEEPDVNLELSCSSEERGSDSSGIDSSEQKRFSEKLEKLSNEMKRIKLKMLHPSKSNGNHSTGVTTHSVGIKTHHHEGDSISHQTSMAQSEETKVQNDKDTKVGIDHKDKASSNNIHLTSQQNMPQEEVDLNMTGLMFEDVLSSALGDESDILTGSGLSGLKDELAGTGIGEMIKNKTKNNEQDVQTKVHSTTPNNQHISKTPVPQQHAAKPPAQHQPVHHQHVQPHQFHHPQPQLIQQQQPPPQQQAIVLPVFQVQQITPHHIIHQPVQNNNQPMSMPNPVPQNNIMNEQVVIPQPNTFNKKIQAQSGFTGHANNSKNNKPPENLDDLDKMFLSGEKIEDHPLRRQKVKSNENS